MQTPARAGTARRGAHPQLRLGAAAAPRVRRGCEPRAGSGLANRLVEENFAVDAEVANADLVLDGIEDQRRRGEGALAVEELARGEHLLDEVLLRAEEAERVAEVAAGADGRLEHVL